VLEKEAFENLWKWMVAEFPSSTTPNVMDSMSFRILQRLSQSLLFAEYPSAADVPPNLRAFRRKADLAFNVLRTLEENAGSLLTREDNTLANNPHFNPLPFRSMGINVPTSTAEIRDVFVQVLSELKNVLEVCAFVASSSPID
jgi:hypothetical protein